MYLRELTEKDENEVIKMIKEFESEKVEDPFEGIGDFENVSNYQELLKILELNKHIEDVKPNYVSQITYGLFDETNHIYGIINIRYYLVDSLLRRGGNIGYAIRPSERNKGYAKLMLKLALKKCKELNINKNSIYENQVLITCRKENIASARTIMGNGGKLAKEEYLDEYKELEQYYWIEI